MTKLNITKENRSLLAKRRNSLLSRKTPAEVHVEQLLNEWGEKFMAQKGFLGVKSHYIVDFYLPKRRKLCLEVDGPYHLDPTQMEYDRRRDEYLVLRRGFRVIRITNKFALSLDAHGLHRLIK